MLGNRTTLVLGAGASVAFGYPLGDELRQKILEVRNRDSLLRQAGLPSRKLREFVDTFQQSQMASIDAFLARRPEFGEIGKRTIAALLLEAEQKVSISGCVHEDRWYQYLLNRMLPESWDDLDFEKLSVITFNYDRSFEQYFLVSLQAAYGKSQAQVLAKLGELEVIHIYGSLGATLPAESGYLTYGEGVSVTRVSVAAEAIRVIPEGRTSDETLVKARKLLIDARVIGYFGFGFDKINCERLDIRSTSANMIENRGSRRRRQVVATCLGMTRAEASSVSQLFNTAGYDAINGLPRGMYDTNCIGALRESLILGR